MPNNINIDFTFTRFPLPDHNYQETISVEEINTVLSIVEELIKKGPIKATDYDKKK